MLEWILFFISSGASVIGAITGIGGGIIIKPLVDAAGLLDAGTVGFLSGCTVLAMSAVSMWRNMRAGISTEKNCTVYLAIGSAGGGVVGKYIFRLFLAGTAEERLITVWQNAIILLLTVVVLVYELRKHKIVSYHIKNITAITAVGFVMGMLSAFLGIGGGPINIMILSLCFSMEGKAVAVNSILIILFSQISSLIYTLFTGVPSFELIWLCVMVVGGILGGILGNKILHKLSVRNMEKMFRVLLCGIMLVCIYNMC